MWVPLKKAIEIFGNYENYHKTNIANYGLYRREFHALAKAYKIINGIYGRFESFSPNSFPYSSAKGAWTGGYGVEGGSYVTNK